MPVLTPRLWVRKSTYCSRGKGRSRHVRLWSVALGALATADILYF